MNGITVRLNHTDKVTFAGWAKNGKGEYRHETGRQVRRDCNSGLWEVIGGPDCGRRYGTMHVAMHYARK